MEEIEEYGFTNIIGEKIQNIIKMTKNKERILLALLSELEPLGFHYLKSKGEFRKKVSKDICVYIDYDASCFHHGFTDIMLFVHVKYADIDRAIREIKDLEPLDYGPFGLRSRLQDLLPGGGAANPEYCFSDTDSEEIFKQKLWTMLFHIKTYMVPYIEKLFHPDGAIETAIELDKNGIVHPRCAVSIMYCVWRHDKQTALEYLERKRRQMFNLVTPQEWELLKLLKNGENIPQKDRPFNAIAYEEYVESAKKCREWIEARDY